MTLLGCTDFRLLTVEPDTVPLAGGPVRVSYEGPLPDAYRVTVDDAEIQVVDESEGALEFDAPGSAEAHTATITVYGAIRLVVLPLPLEPMGSIALEYEPSPATARVSLCPSELAAVRPELARPCAREARLMVWNEGEADLAIDSVTAGDGYSFVDEGCIGGGLVSWSCSWRVCFDGSTPEQAASDIVVTTNGGIVTVDGPARVEEPAAGLDPTFAGDGAVLTREWPYNSSDPDFLDIVCFDDGASVAMWEYSYEFVRVSSMGVLDHPSSGTTTWAWLQRMTPDAVGGLLATLGYTTAAGGVVVRFGSDASRDSSFGGAGEIVLADSTFPSRLHVRPDGYLLVANGTRWRAYTPSGTLDTSYGNQGESVVVEFGADSQGQRFWDASGVDSQGRLYLLHADGVIRMTAQGALDAGFDVPVDGHLLYVDRDDTVLVGTDTGLVRIDPAGTVTPVPLAAVSGVVMPFADVATDSAGALFAIDGVGTLVRWSPGFATGTVVGFDGAMRVDCPKTALGCYVMGTTVSGGQELGEKYLIRLAP